MSIDHLKKSMVAPVWWAAAWGCFHFYKAESVRYGVHRLCIER